MHRPHPGDRKRKVCGEESVGVTQVPSQPPGGLSYAAGLQDKEREADSRWTAWSKVRAESRGQIVLSLHFLVPVNALEQ